MAKTVTTETEVKLQTAQQVAAAQKEESEAERRRKAGIACMV